jgi:EAL domain-containing protein (putative c-di-GMP-specific phosphodiesterase class I)
VESNTGESKGRVLVAEDEAALGRAIARLLTSSGFQVTLAADGPSATDAIMTSGFEVVLTDINMPGSSGLDLLKLVRAYDLDVPVILMTGAPDLEQALAAMRLGALQYLRKPFPLETVPDVVNRAAKLHQLAIAKRRALLLSGRSESEAGDVAGLGVVFERALSSARIAFQPIVRVSTREIVAYEALLRSSEPGLPDPVSVLNAGERLGRSCEIGRRVCSLVAEAIDASRNEWLWFVNVHAEDILDLGRTGEYSPLSRYATQVVLEITERAALENVKDIAGRIELLRSLGYRLAIDDLGAGYAGLTSFATLEPEFVKLDMSLVRGIHQSDIRQKLVRSVIGLCTELGKCVIAEGVEHLAERDCLRGLGCDWMQGYSFAPPGPSFPEPRWD